MEDIEGFTELAMGKEQQQQQVPNKHGLYAEFYMEAERDPVATLEAGHPKFRDVPYVRIMVPGDKSSIVCRPVRTGQLPNHDNNRFHNEYVAFLQGAETPMMGLPLAEWPLVTKSQVLELNHFGIKTVENLAELTDTNVQKFMGLVSLREKARTYIEASKNDAPFQQLHAEIDSRNDQILELKNTVEQMMLELKDLKKTGKK